MGPRKARSTITTDTKKSSVAADTKASRSKREKKEKTLAQPPPYAMKPSASSSKAETSGKKSTAKPAINKKGTATSRVSKKRKPTPKKRARDPSYEEESASESDEDVETEDEDAIMHDLLMKETAEPGVYAVRAILAEDNGKYLLDWMPDARTGEEYDYSWLSASEVGTHSIAEWKQRSVKEKAKLTAKGKKGNLKIAKEERKTFVDL